MPAGIIPRCAKRFKARPFRRLTLATQPRFDLLQGGGYVLPRTGPDRLREQGRCRLTDCAGVNFHPGGGNAPSCVQIEADVDCRAADGRAGVAPASKAGFQWIVGQHGCQGENLRRVKLG